MRSLTGSILQIPRYTIYSIYIGAMWTLFFVTAILTFPFWIFGQIKNQFLP